MVFASSEDPQDKSTRLSPGGCLYIGGIVKEVAQGRQTGVSPGKILSAVVMDDLKFENLPEEVKTLLKLSAVVVMKPGVSETPEHLEEGFNLLCFESRGDVTQMNQTLKEILGVEEKEI